jgi:WD40 repeat protein
MSNRGDVIVSGDADGVVKIWDIRMVAELGTIDVGQYPINKVAIDRSGTKVLAASDDGNVKVLDAKKFSVVGGDLLGHDGPVQSVCIAANDSFFISGSSDCTFKIWSK